MFGLRTRRRRAAMQMQTDAVTGVRALASLHVMCSHFSGPLFGLVLVGGAAIPVFFLVSGFVLTLGYGADGNKMDVATFYLKRFAKLAPLYYIGNTMGFLLEEAHIESRSLAAEDVPAQLLMTTFWLFSWRLPPLLDLPTAMPLFLTWTMSTIMGFYLLYPFVRHLLMPLRDEDQTRTAYALYVLSIAISVALEIAYRVFPMDGVDPLRPNPVAYSIMRAHPLCRVPVFAMGCCAAYESMRRRKLGNNAQSQLWLAGPLLGLWLFFVIMAIAISHTAPRVVVSWVRPAVEILSPILFYHLVVALCEPGSSCAIRFLRSRPLQFVGEISFTIYLFHYEALRIVSTLVLTCAGCTPGTPWPFCAPGPGPCVTNFHCFGSREGAGSVPFWLKLVTWALSMVVAISAAWVLTHYVERPMTAALAARIKTFRSPSKMRELH